MDFKLQKEIVFELDEFSLKASAEVLLRLKQLCLIYNVTPEEIVAQWVAFCSRKNNLEDPTLVLLDHMERTVILQRVIKKPKLASKSISLHAYNSSLQDIINLGYGPSDKMLDVDKCPPLTLESQNLPSTSNSRTPTHPSSYATRSGSLNILCSFGGDTEWRKEEEFSCDISAHDPSSSVAPPPSPAPCSWRDVLDALNRIIEREADLLEREYGIREWASGHLPSTECVPVVGRVVSEEGVLLLEGSWTAAGGRAMPLDVSQLDSYALFPGQVIAGIGINSSGNKLIMKTLLPVTFPARPLKPPDFPNCIDSLSVVIAAGPFAIPDTLSYEPLWDLMKYVMNNKPNVVILVGPFVDAKSNAKKVGESNERSEDIFKHIVTTIFKGLKLLSTKVVLVPSTTDAQDKSVYPTPPFEIDRSTQRLYLAPDPCLLHIEGVVFAITSTDILLHLAKEEITNPSQLDKLGRLCSHILTQKQFYPLYPSLGLDVDIPRCERHAQLPVMPHVLIVPSDLHYFIKDVHGCCCINPHRMAKFSNGGSFARLKVCRVSNAKYTGSLIDSIHAQVLKI